MLDQLTPYGGYWFWKREEGSIETTTGNARRKLRRHARLAGLSDIHPHHFRHSFSVSMLSQGVSVPDVAAILGNTPRIVEKHYAPWVPKRQDALENALKKTWPVLKVVNL
ncbi:MAG: hypothetical protein FJW39_29350 [Acidobacteria bacterium]|nr:hypothetical protein [Acidobacteriota bacterium]